MGRKKTQLLTRDQYGRHVAVLRCAELIHAHGSETGPVELRQEDSRFSPWDDLTEIHRAGTGRETHVWQVKRQRERLSQEQLDPLLRTLGERTELVAHLALYHPVEVQDVGSLTSLDELCQRVRQPGFDGETATEWSATEGEWILFVQNLLEGSIEAAFRLFERLFVEPLGPAQQIKRQALVLLDRHFVEPTGVHDRLMTFFADYPDGAVRITHALLEKELRAFERHSSPGTATAASLKRAYLDAVVESYGRLSPLRFLSGRGGPNASGPRLSEIFAMPALRSSSEDEEPPRIPKKPTMTGNVFAPSEEEELPAPLLERGLARTDELRLVELLRDPQRLAERPLFLLEGGVGAGKSTILEHLLFVLAERAQQEPEAPLPVRIESRRLAHGLAEAVAHGVPPIDPRLLQAHLPGVIYLVDGLDEVDPRRSRKVQECLDELSRQSSTVAMVMVGRPSTTYVEVPDRTVRLRIAPWSRAQLDDFLEKWHQHDPERVTALSPLVRNQALLPVLSNPLTATFALLLAKEEPEALKNRASLFRGIVGRLFSDWVKHREPPEGAPRPSWATIAPAFRQLALESLKEGKEDLTQSDLRKHLGQEAIDRELEWIDEAHRWFGLLMYQEDGRYRFLLKGIAEHLAGAELLERGPQEMLAAAREKWAEEPVRHALGLGLERKGSQWVIDTLHKLLPGPRGVRVAELRPLLVAAQVSLDLGETGGSVVEPIAEALSTLLTLETSVWIQRVVGETVREMARVGGDGWDALFRRLLPRLLAQGEPAQWYAAQADQTCGWWLGALKHRDPNVRRVAVDRLSAWVDEPKIREALFQQLADETYSPFSEAPALRAGLALRRAARDENFRGLQPFLIQQASSGGQLLGGAAALALLPGEAPTPLLAKCLRKLHQGIWSYPVIVEELAASPERAAELEAVWMNWRSDTHDSRTMPLEPIVPRAGKLAPLSSWGRRQGLRAIGPAMARWSLAEWQHLGFLVKDHALTLALSEVAWDHPQGMEEWLRHSEAAWLTPDAELLLGEAAVRHLSLRTALLERWRMTQDESARSLFPGGALAALIAGGDEEAARVYAQWLHVTIWLRTGYESVFLSPTALRHPTVRPAAIERAMDIWKQFREGELKEGKRITLSGFVMASVLGALRPAWEDATDLRQELLRLAREGTGEDLTHALRVFSSPAYPRELEDILVARFEGLAEQNRADHLGHVGFWIDWAERASITARLQPALEKVRLWKSWHRFLATAALLPLQPGQARWLSQEVAQDWPDVWDLLFLRRSMLARLVHANIAAWHQRWREVMEPDAIPIRSVFELARILGPRLDPKQQKELYATLHARLGVLETYWIRDGRDPWDSVRLADLYARLRFEAE
jgi:hypothetical protein